MARRSVVSNGEGPEGGQVMTSYGPLCSEFYELDKPVGGEYPDVGYYLQRLREVGGRALEVAVGTGRLLVPLLQAGLAVDGVDSSE